METRQAKPEDVPQISAMLEHLYAYNAGQQPRYYRQAAEAGGYPRSVIDSGSADLLIALDGSAIVGLLHAEERSSPPYESSVPHRYGAIVALFVDPTYRGQGVGERLLRAARKWARARNLDCIELSVVSENEETLKFYEKMGFETVAHTLRLPIA